MFETGKAIREAKLRQIHDDGWQKGRQEGLLEGRQETAEFFRTVLEESGVSLPSEVAARLYEEQSRRGS